MDIINICPLMSKLRKTLNGQPYVLSILAEDLEKIGMEVDKDAVLVCLEEPTE